MIRFANASCGAEVVTLVNNSPQSLTYGLSANTIDAPSTSMARYFTVSPTNAIATCNDVTVTAWSDANAVTPFASTADFTFSTNTAPMTYTPTAQSTQKIYFKGTLTSGSSVILEMNFYGCDPTGKTLQANSGSA